MDTSFIVGLIVGFAVCGMFFIVIGMVWRERKRTAEVAKMFALDVLKSNAKEFINLTELTYSDTTKIIERLKEKDADGLTPLHRAAKDTSNAAIICHMITLGADVNVKDNAGRTPLHYAAGCNPNVDVAKCLIEHGADVRAKDDKDCTPLTVSFHCAKSDEVGLYFLDLMMGQKGVEVTDPIRLAEIKRHFDRK